MSRTLLALSLVAAVPLADAASEIELARGVHLIPGRFVPGSQPDGNTVVFTAPGGLIVVDTGRHPEHTQAILDLAQRAGRPIAAVVNTHWHLDHVGGNLLVRDAFPEVRVHASAALGEALGGFLANYRRQLEQMIAATPDAAAQKPFRAEIGLIDAGDRLRPDVVVDRSLDASLASRPLRLEIERNAVTAGDVWILDPATRVLVSGDLVTLPAPFLDTACPRRWAAALARLERADFRVLVPGHGAPMSRRDVRAYRRAFDRLLACAASERPADTCTEGWIRDLGRLVPQEEHAFTRTLMAYYVGLLRGDAARLEKHCA